MLFTQNVVRLALPHLPETALTQYRTHAHVVSGDLPRVRFLDGRLFATGVLSVHRRVSAPALVPGESPGPAPVVHDHRVVRSRALHFPLVLRINVECIIITRAYDRNNRIRYNNVSIHFKHT